MENKKSILAGSVIAKAFLALSNINANKNSLVKFLRLVPMLNCKPL